MATVTDVEVANASFPNVRQDLNDILEAIATNFSADAEPTTTYPNQWWYETDTNKLYIRNEDNDAWIHVLTLDQTTDTVSSVEGVSADAISEGNSSVEVIDTGTGYIQINVDGAERARFDASGNFVIGATSAASDAGLSKIFQLGSASDTSVTMVLKDDDGDFEIGSAGGSLRVYDDGIERMRIDSSGRVGIGTSSPDAPLHIKGDLNYVSALNGNGTITLSSDNYGNAGYDGAPSIVFEAPYSSDTANTIRVPYAIIEGRKESASSGATSGYLAFSTSAVSSGGTSERMRIDSSGNLALNTTSANANYQMTIQANSTKGALSVDGPATNGYWASEWDMPSGSTYGILFKNGGSNVGNIRINASSTSYNTSSDYRLKENVVDLTNAIDRVKQLNVHRFNFIGEDQTVDGFLAHEAQEVVPEAVSGEKDAMRTEEYQVSPALGEIFVPAVSEVLDEEDNVVTEAQDEQIISSDVEQPETLEEGQQWRETTPAVMGEREVPDYQGIDQSKLVPLLTGALQEAISRIETLEAEVAALKA